LIGQTISHYRIVEKLGGGGMGVVYRARDEQLERDVAIKTLPPRTLGDDNARKRFRKEALSLAKLNHPGIATIHEFGSQDGLDFLVTEYIPGITLDHKLIGGALPAKEVIALGLQLAQSLAAAHEQGIVHRDLKPANLRIMPDGRLKILDFGLAQLMPRPSDMGLTETLIESQEITGTLPYMAPEQLRGEPADARTDIWATGAVCYEMATGRRPFPEKNSPLLINSILNQKPEPPSKLNGEVSPGLECVILKALDKDSALRHQTARELGVDLERLSAGSSSRVLLRRSLWRYVPLLGTLVMLLSLVVSGLLLVRRRNRDREQSASPTVNHRRSVAVLGFKNLAGKTDEAWLSTAISEMLTTELSAGEQLRTVPGETVAQIKRNLALAEAESYAKETLNKIHAQTSADDVVLGSYLALGAAADGKVHLDLRLQDAQAGETIAALSEEGKETELTELVSRIGARLREKLGAGDIAPNDLAAVKASLPSTMEAVRLYSEGLAKLRTYDTRAALHLFQKAVAADPNYALAHSALSEAWSAAGNHDQEKEEAKRAFDLSASLSRQDRLWIEGQYRETTQETEKAMEIYKTLFDLHPDNLEYGLRFAWNQGWLGKWQESLATLESLRKLPAPERDDPRIDGAEAFAATQVSNWQMAQMALERAIKKGNESGARLVVAEALNLEGMEVFSKQGKPDQAMAALEQAREIYSSVGDPGLRASNLNAIAILVNEKGDFARAEKMYQEARDIDAQIGNDYALWDDLNNLAGAKLQQANLKDAMESYQQALVLSRKVESKFMESVSLRGIGDTLVRQGDPRGARQFYEKSLGVCRESKDSELLHWGLTSVAGLLVDQGDLQRAQSLLQEALELSRKSERKDFMGSTLEDFAGLLVKESQLSEARARYEQAISIYKELGEADKVVRNRLNLANISLEEGHPADAEAAAREAREVFRKERSVVLELSAVTSLARALLMEGKLSEATIAVDQAKALLGKSLDFQQQFEVAIVSARVIAQGHDPAEAEKRLNVLLDESTRAGLVEYQFEIRLALAEIEMSSGKTALGHVRLVELEKDARSRGFLLIARKAAAAAKSA
jgi:serine/threonine protein kinase/tetratricopeptide (TPR) repeat protein